MRAQSIDPRRARGKQAALGVHHLELACDAARVSQPRQPQRVGGRLFIWRDSTWTDLNHGDSLHVVTVAPYSDAYLALLQALPDLAKSASLEPADSTARVRVISP